MTARRGAATAVVLLGIAVTGFAGGFLFYRHKPFPFEPIRDAALDWGS